MGAYLIENPGQPLDAARDLALRNPGESEQEPAGLVTALPYDESGNWPNRNARNGPSHGAKAWYLPSMLEKINLDPATSAFPPTERTRVRRLPARATYDREEVYAILDAGIVCQLGFVEQGRPIVIPTAYARRGDEILIHGSSKSRTLIACANGAEVCLNVTLIDGLVLARSAFHHSVNYRSVVVFGRAEVIEDEADKLEALEAFLERLLPGRWREVRVPSEAELRATLVLRLKLNEVVAKRRSGPPLDDEADYQLPVWAGVLPLAPSWEAPVPDQRLHPEVRTPGFVAPSVGAELQRVTAPLGARAEP